MAMVVLLPTMVTIAEKNHFQQLYRSASDQQQHPNLLELHQQTRFLASSSTELYEQRQLLEKKKITEKKGEENGLELMAEFQIKEFMGLVLELAQLGDGRNEVVKQAQLNFGPNGSKLNGLNPPVSYSLQFSNHRKSLNSPLLLTVNSKSIASTVPRPATMARKITPESQAPTESVYIAALALGIANQWTNILRDVGEDARRGGIHLPHGEPDVNDYNNFTRGACVNKLKKMLATPIAYVKSLLQESDILRVGSTGYGIAMDTILVIVAQRNRSVQLKGRKRSVSTVIVTVVFGKEIVWLYDKFISFHLEDKVDFEGASNDRSPSY